MSLHTFIAAVLADLRKEKAVRMAAIFWMLWTTRNDRVWRNKVWAVQVMHNQISMLISTWNETYKRENTRVQLRDDGANWEPPALHWLKCNVDATLSSVGVFGAAIRNHEGRFVAARNDFSYVGLGVKQCIQIARGIGDVVVRHVRRSANRVAHVLARATDSSSGSVSWSDVPPDCISSMLAY
ncbi:PREDICTED: uncharacterized protein LOC109190916 [Ipomoea nil]|uniref:uncharacterized protein LOC109190916 n=1 Tax=Ipomoea nil TaxID=35883 RepID=UPI000901988B|nr:PREDICTED: uncharacterized protein LOC109190916 [Ipomoea nil]